MRNPLKKWFKKNSNWRVFLARGANFDWSSENSCFIHCNANSCKIFLCQLWLNRTLSADFKSVFTIFLKIVEPWKFFNIIKGIFEQFCFVELCIPLRGDSVCERIGIFFIKLCRSDLSFSRKILTFLYLKFKTSAHAQIAINHYYVFLTNFLTWYEFATYIGDIFW